MKKITTLIAVIVLSCTALNADAENTRKTTVIGAVTGGAIGQAIGHDTEATLIGIAVGGVAGYMVGNEMDKNGNVRQVWVKRNEPSYQVHKHVTVIVEPAREIHHPYKNWRKKHHYNNRHNNKWHKPYNQRANNYHPEWRN